MLRVSRYLPVHGAKCAEFASFAVCFLEFSGWTPSLLVVVRIQRIWLIRSNFPVFSVNGQRSET